MFDFLKNITKGKEIREVDYLKNINIVPTMQSEITENSVWCATFQLVWEDFQYKLLENNFTVNGERNKTIDSLLANKIGEKILSEKDYYKIIGKKTIKLKEEIEKELIKRFNERSSILDKVDFREKTDNILIYTMLKKIFLFKHKFDELDKEEFGKSKEKVEYFGINKKTKNIEELANQIKVLFYNTYDEYSIMLKTNKEDRIILYRTNNNYNFASAFNEIKNKSKNYSNTNFKNKDTLKVPKLNFNILQNYDELIGKTFIRSSDNEIFKISQAMQTIEFELDETGGKVKSEALINVGETAIRRPQTNVARHFDFNDTFYLFLIEKGKEKPYLALRVQDIKDFI